MPGEASRTRVRVTAHPCSAFSMFLQRVWSANFPAPHSSWQQPRSLSNPMLTKRNLVQPMANTPQPAANQGRESTQPVLPPSSLTPLFYPKTVAVIGATEKPASVGRTVLRNLMEQPSGATIFPINPHRPNVLG